LSQLLHWDPFSNLEDRSFFSPLGIKEEEANLLKLMEAIQRRRKRGKRVLNRVSC